MKKLKRSRSFDSALGTKKQKQIGNLGIFAYNVPQSVKYEDLASVCDTFLIPKYGSQHLRIAFYCCSTKLETQKIHDFIENKNKNSKERIFFMDIVPKENKIMDVANVLDRIASKVEIILNESNKNIAKFELRFIKELALKVVTENYSKFKRAFEYFDKRPQINAKKENESPTEITESASIEWLIIFNWCWFFIHRVKRKNIQDFKIFFESFPVNGIRKIFFQILKINHIRKYLMHDLLAQYFLLDAPFKNIKKVMTSLLTLLKENDSIKLIDYCSSFVGTLRPILNSPLIKTLLQSDGTNHRKIVEEFLSNTFLMRLPTSIRGMTLCNRTVVIRKQNCDQEAYNKANMDTGFTLMTALNEFSQFFMMAHLQSDSDWFGKRSLQNPWEVGLAFREKVFGTKPKTISKDAALYILDINNWQKNISRFQYEFQKLNVYDYTLDNYELSGSIGLGRRICQSFKY